MGPLMAELLGALMEAQDGGNLQASISEGKNIIS